MESQIIRQVKGGLNNQATVMTTVTQNWGECSTLADLLEVYEESDVQGARIILGLKPHDLREPNFKQRCYDPYTKKPLDKEKDKKIITKKMEICTERVANIIREVQNKIEEMSPDEKARALALEKTKFSMGVLPSLFAQLQDGYGEGAVSGQDEWRRQQEEKQRKTYDKSMASAQRRAEDVIKNQIKEKIAGDHSVEQQRASKARLAAFRKEQAFQRAEKKKIDDAKRKEIKDNVIAADQKRREWGDDCMDHIDAKMQRGIDKRTKGKYETMDPTLKLAAEARRNETFKQNKNRLMKTLNDQLQKQDNAERTLQQRKDERRAALDERIRKRQESFDKKRKSVNDHLDEMQRQREQRHDDFENHFEHVKKTREQHHRDVSKGACEKRTNDFNKRNANWKQLKADQACEHDELQKATSEGLEHRFADAMNKRMNSIKEYQQIAGVGCMGALQKENWQAVIRKRDLNIESILLKVAKRQDDFRRLQDQRNEFKAKQVENYRAQNKREQETAATLYRLKSEVKPERIQGCLNKLGLNMNYEKLQAQMTGKDKAKDGQKD